MKNTEIIKLVEQIVSPYFEFNMNDFYGDRGSCEFPNIDEIKVLYFKKRNDIHDTKFSISIAEQNKLVEKIQNN